MHDILFREVLKNLPTFCLERWQSLHETKAEVLLSESGVHPLSISELEELGVDLKEISKLELSYGWTKGSPKLREHISSLYSNVIDEENIIVTNGSAEANLLSVLSLVSNGDVVIVDMPNYMQVYGLLKWVGARIIPVWRKPPKWDLPLEEFLNFIKDRSPKAIFVTDPNNPTGNHADKKVLSELAEEAVKNNITLVFDEVYWGLELDDPKASIIEVAGPYNVVSVSGLSKVYGLPGLRIGWVAGPKDLIDKAWRVKDYTSIAPSIISDYIASRVLEPEAVKKLKGRAKNIVSENINIARGILVDYKDVLEPYWPSAGAFLWARIPWSNDTLNVAQHLFKNHSILINPGECFELPGFVRIGIGQKPYYFKENFIKLMEALRAVHRTL
ncbi:MAG: hypothetical protein B7O98_06135 [Zestosphaera tikiterensis]|uniref:Aminotransferase n=1 Tax=Zestosphaera tikiterensis TaxID=1973259 RepID=A0A2R7Y3Z9_9CREN|nr:MAG: hypothetical protein B7O98_06135 [Zestosphaera tikiterensis]